jgi:nitrogen fixation/metabolism regulation signal transduction histidine kinase
MMRSRRLSFATRLFIALFLLSAVPSVALVGLATWGLRSYVELAGAGGAWQGVGETGRDLLNAVDASEPDSLVEAAAAEHESELSRSVNLARRWDLIAGRLARALPWVALVLGLSLGIAAALTARQLSRQLSRPVGEVVDWAGRLAREEPLPQPSPAHQHGAPEFSALRDAFRNMAAKLAEGRRQALEAERLKGLSEMARRVAHEIKNPLTPLMLATRQARLHATQGRTDTLDEPLGVIEHEAQRLDEMARSFSQLGRLPEGPTSEIDLSELIRDLLASDLPEPVTGILNAPEKALLVKGHLEALTRAFRNLIGNAVEALSDQPDPRIEVTITEADGFVDVAITDNGPGVRPEHLDRIWFPDFTTKKRGTGLGLALVRQTVQAHGGSVELIAREDGACFLTQLPVSGRESA